jgi:putative transposase
MANRIPLAQGEWYHCFNRGVDKRQIFDSRRDYERFLMLLYISNSQKQVRISNISQNKQGPTLLDVLSVNRGLPLVDLGAYSLMPNHFHLLLRPIESGGISKFLQKVTTGYGMYFNKKNERSGTLFQGKFKSILVDDDIYFRRLLNYIHANAAELFETSWKEGIIKNKKLLREKLIAYPYASLRDYLGEIRPESTIICRTTIEEMLEKMFTVDDLIEEAQIFASENKQGRTLLIG